MKIKSVFLLLATLVMAPGGVGLATTVTNGLAAHLKFDGDLLDATSNGVNGTPVGTPGFATGVLGQAIHLTSDGLDLTNNYVSLQYPPVLQFGSDATGNTTDFSVAFWVKIFSQNDDKPFISNKDWNSPLNQGWVVATEPDGMAWNLRDDGGSGRRDSPHVAPQLEDGNWHHLAVTFQRTNVGDIYVDGQLVNSSSIAPDPGNPVGSLDTVGLQMNVNLGQDGTGEYTDGPVGAAVDMLMDDLGVWRRVLTADEVAEIYNKGLLGKTLDQESPGVLPTVIVNQPTNQTVVAGVAASFNVDANGFHLTYQWSLNGTNLVAATNKTYAILATQAADAGTYGVVVKGDGGTVISSNAVLTVLSPAAVCDLTNGLVAHLKFDGDYTDASGNGAAGTPVGAPTFQDGILGKAVRITSTVDDVTNNFVSLGSTAALQLGTNDATFAFWTKVYYQAGDKPFLSNKDWSSHDNPGYVIASEPDGLMWNLKDSISTARDSRHVGSQVLDGAWHHVAVTFVRANVGSVYVDGVLLTSANDAPDPGNAIGSIGTGTNLSLNLGQDGTGNYTATSTAGIDMLMDDLAVWNRALSAAEVACIVSHGRAGKSLDELLPVPTQITAQPVGVTNEVGVAASFRVVANGVQLTYQWQHNGQPIPGATNSTYSLLAAATTDAGAYTVVVTGTLGTVTSNPATLAVNPAPASCDVSSGLMAHLEFDGDYSDASGNSLNGSAVGSPTFVPGLIGQAVHIVSTKDDATNNYVTLGAPSALRFSTNDFSLAFWTKVLAQSGDKPFVANADWGGRTTPGFVLASEPDGVAWSFEDSSGAPRRASPIVAPQVEDGDWHHVAVTFQRSGMGVLYVDGQAVDTTSIAPAPGNPLGSVDTGASGLKLNFGQDGTGNYTAGGTAGLDMYLDDLAIWSRVLAPTEVACIVSQGRAGKTFSASQTPGGDLQVSVVNGQLVISWTGGGTLQSATNVIGPWTDVSNASNPYPIQPSQRGLFFRLKPGGTTQSLMRISSGADGAIHISWTGTGTLQSAPKVSGPWSTVTNGVNPFVFQPTGRGQFYRVQQ